MSTLNENWYPNGDLAALMGHVGEALKRVEARGDDNPLFIEEGCWEGRSASYIIREINPTVLECVDTWVPDGHSSILDVEGRNVYDNFMTNATEAGDNFKAYAMDAHVYEDILLERGQPISFIHVDACHEGDFVQVTLEKLKPLFRDFSIVCGHDIHHPPIQKSIKDAGFEYTRSAGLWLLTNPVL